MTPPNSGSNYLQLPDMQRGYLDVVGKVMRDGEYVRVRDRGTYELLDVTFDFFRPSLRMLPTGLGRKVNTRLAAVEALSLVAGSAEYDLTRAAAPGYVNVLVSSRPEDFAYAAYGPRVGETLDTVINLLATDETTRQAVLSIWRRDDLYHDGDRPCTLTIQFLLRDGYLNMVVNMRSNDVWRGLAYDAFVFSQLHRTVAHRLNLHLGGRDDRSDRHVTVGWYRHHAGSFHLYEDDYIAASQLFSSPLSMPSTEVNELPDGVVTPPGLFPDQAAAMLLHPPSFQPTLVEDVEALNPWYAEQMKKVYDSTETTA